MLTIDGSFGEGGGQIVRSSLALSLVTGKSFTIDNIRAGRKRPGLMRQHLTALEAAAAISHAEVEGAAIGSRRLAFRPGKVRSGRYEFSVGTAGSTTLVLQTILPALTLAEGQSQLTLEGGTHNPFAPPFDFLAKTYCPLLNRLGPNVTVKLQRPGFYPAGGGRMTVEATPTKSLGRLELTDRGPIRSHHVRAIVANLPRHIGDRECRTIARKTGWDEACFSVEEISGSHGPGNVVIIELQSERLTEVFTGFGKRGVRAENVATQVLNAARHYLAADVPVGSYLADQLMLPLGIGAHLGTGGGTFRTMPLSRHAATQAEVVSLFMQLNVSLEDSGRGGCLVRIGS